MAGWRKARLSYVSLLKAELPARVPEEAPVTPHLGRNGPCGRGAVLPASRNRSRDRPRLPDMPTCLRRFVDVLSGWDTDKGHADQIAAFADHVAVDPRAGGMSVNHHGGAGPVSA